MRKSVTKSLAFGGLAAALFALASISSQAQQDAPSGPPSGDLVIKATVRRVIVDVVVTGADGKPARGLTRDDFSLTEDGKTQHVLSFDPHDLEPVSDAPLPKLPSLPSNTYLNLPTQPERGPLYILLLDLINTEVDDQVTVRALLSKFVASKPPGTRFAVFVLSDELRLVQGFTSDPKLLSAVLDTHHPKPHVPMVFLYGRNYGKGNEGLMVDVFNHIGTFVDGLPGRKNLIWVSGGFPMRLFPSDDDGPGYAEHIKATLDLLARNQVSIYPIDARGVVLTEAHGPAGSASGSGAGGTAGGSGGSGSGGTGGGAGDGGSAAGGSSGGSGAGGTGSGGGGGGGAPVDATPSGGPSQLAEDYDMEDQVARLTGGHAFYSNNDVATELADATDQGATYYTLSYSPTNKDYNGKLRSIDVKLTKKGYHLSYRRSYYGLDSAGASQLASTTMLTTKIAQPLKANVRPIGDSLGVEMQYGAPMAHDLLFKAHVNALGAPAMGTPEQMADLADEPAYFRKPRKNRPAKPIPPVVLQTFVIDYTLPASQLRFNSGDTGRPTSALEIAAAAYDTDGRLLNGSVQNASQGADGGANPGGAPAALRGFYRIQMQLNVPVAAATSLRLAVRDMSTDRLGTIEISLPLTAEAQNEAQLPAASSPPTASTKPN